MSDFEQEAKGVWTKLSTKYEWVIVAAAVAGFVFGYFGGVPG